MEGRIDRAARPGFSNSYLRGLSPGLQVVTGRELAGLPQVAHLPAEQRFAMQVVASVLPFRVNQYVLETLVDWDAAPDEPMFRLLFPHRDMLPPEDFQRMACLIRGGADEAVLRREANAIRMRLNPHPAGQMEANVPLAGGRPIPGMQHKYRETVLFFPSQGQTCHSYCGFCFRWAQFVGIRELRFAASETTQLHQYLRSHPEVSDLLITGGDPMVMKASHLASYLEPLLAPAFDHISSIRIGTKAISWWPFRFLTDADSYALLRLFERVVKAGKHLAFMAHVNHWRELEPRPTQDAVARIRDTGATIRSQSPVLAHINDDPAVWARMWQMQTRMGIVPYYMFIERDTGARNYFGVPLAKVVDLYREAIQQVSGLARTARGPSMSADPGKVEVQGVAEVHGERVFVLRFIQARDPSHVQRPFFARYDPRATWLDELKPAFGAARFFYEEIPLACDAPAPAA